MPLHELMAYLSFWAMPIAYMFSVGCCCDATGTTCGDGTCSICTSGSAPGSYSLTFASVADLGTPVCTECDDFNTMTFILPEIGDCGYELDAGGGALPCEDLGNLEMCTLKIVLAGPFVALQVITAASGSSCGVIEQQEKRFDESTTSPYDCCVEFTPTSVAGAEAICDWSSATVSIEPV